MVDTGDTVRAWAPGRVNLMGDHTDHTGGWVLPIAVDLGTELTAEPLEDRVELVSGSEGEPAVVPLDVDDPAAVVPAWARYVAGVVAELRPARGVRGRLRSTLPVGAGLSSSAALEVAVALALGAAPGEPQTALACQRAEQRAVGVPCGVMDQLTSVLGVEGHALAIDCHTLAVHPVPLPGWLEVLVVDSGERRRLASSAYAERAAACRRAEADIGPLRLATTEDVARIAHRVLRRRARHVVSENARVHAVAAALRAGDREILSAVMAQSHDSLRTDFEVSTPGLDGLVARLSATPGVIGARLTGAGFGGCVVALAEAGAVLPDDLRWWRVRASGGAHLSPA